MGGKNGNGGQRRRRVYAVTGYGLAGRRETRFVQAENRNRAVEDLEQDEPFVISRVDRICVGLIVSGLVGLALIGLGIWLYARAT